MPHNHLLYNYYNLHLYSEMLKEINLGLKMVKEKEILILMEINSDFSMAIMTVKYSHSVRYLDSNLAIKMD